MLNSARWVGLLKDRYIAPYHCCDLRAKIILAQYNEIQDIYTGDIITI